MEKLGENNTYPVDLAGETISIEDMVEKGQAQIITRPLTDKEMNDFQKSIEDWEEERRRQEAEAQEKHKQDYINNIVRPGETTEETLRRIAEILYYLEQNKAERPVYLR